jgi:iron complex transport system ATP-binding protein
MVVQHISFEVERGSVLAVLGPNGAGKSTLLRAVAGLLPYSGTVSLGDQDIGMLPRKTLASRIAFVPQRSLLASRMRVRTVVTQGRYAHRGRFGRGSPTDDAAVQHALSITRADELADREFTALSYGEQRRVLLARALATGADVLLLDEPTASLDIAHALSFFALLRTLARDGRCVVIVLHQLDDARRIADQGLLMHGGRSVAAGDMRDVVTAKHVQDVYAVRLVEADALGFRLSSEAEP